MTVATDVPTMALWLKAHLADIARSEWASDMLDEITDVVNQMSRMIDSPPPKIYVGRCSTVGVIGRDGTPGDPDPEWEPCGADVYVAEEGRHERATARCPDCGATFSLAIRDEWVRQQYLGRLVTVAEGATLLGIPRATIDTWIYRKKLRRAFTGDDRKAYLFDDLIELARTTRRDAA